MNTKSDMFNDWTMKTVNVVDGFYTGWVGRRKSGYKKFTKAL